MCQKWILVRRHVLDTFLGYNGVRNNHSHNQSNKLKLSNIKMEKDQNNHALIFRIKSIIPLENTTIKTIFCELTDQPKISIANTISNHGLLWIGLQRRWVEPISVWFKFGLKTYWNLKIYSTFVCLLGKPISNELLSRRSWAEL